MLIQYTVDNPSLPSQHVFPTSSSSRWNAQSSLGMPSCREEPPSIWDTHGISGNVFANPAASSSAASYPQEWNPFAHARTNGNQTPIQDQRCQSGPSAKSSVIPGEGDSYRADQQRLQFSDLHFGKFNAEVCTFSQFPTEAMQWIKEVETVDSVCSVRGIQTP